MTKLGSYLITKLQEFLERSERIVFSDKALWEELRWWRKAKAVMPSVKGRLTKAARVAKLFERHARVCFFKEADDLLIGKPGLFESRFSSKLANFNMPF